jgi:hypothetical protein
MKGVKALLVISVVLLLGTFVYAGSRTHEITRTCLTEAEVFAYAERSRHGISLTCNEQVRQRNLARLKAAGRN